MSLFGGLYDYERAGAGVAKNAPKKKPFFAFWELYFRKFWALIRLNMLTFLFCLPVVTIGPALAGMTKVLRSYVIERPGFMFHDFWKGFTENWKKSVPVGLLDVLFAVSAVCALKVYPELASNSESGGVGWIILCVLSVSFALTVVMMNFYIMSMIVATDLTFSEIIKNSFFLTCVALKKNIITLIIIAAISLFLLLCTYLHFFTVILLPIWAITFIGFIAMFNSYPQIQKYVIDPYYEANGQVNPEYGFSPYGEEEIVFEDKGGQEAPIDLKKSKGKKKKNKTIS